MNLIKIPTDPKGLSEVINRAKLHPIKNYDIKKQNIGVTATLRMIEKRYGYPELDEMTMQLITNDFLNMFSHISVEEIDIAFGLALKGVSGANLQTYGGGLNLRVIHEVIIKYLQYRKSVVNTGVENKDTDSLNRAARLGFAEQLEEMYKSENYDKLNLCHYRLINTYVHKFTKEEIMEAHGLCGGKIKAEANNLVNDSNKPHLKASVERLQRASAPLGKIMVSKYLCEKFVSLNGFSVNDIKGKI